jgi:hypothetical protein
MKRWKIVAGNGTWWFDDLNKAKAQAKKFHEAIIMEKITDYFWPRYYVDGHRLRSLS